MEQFQKWDSLRGPFGWMALGRNGKIPRHWPSVLTGFSWAMHPGIITSTNISNRLHGSRTIPHCTDKIHTSIYLTEFKPAGDTSFKNYNELSGLVILTEQYHPILSLLSSRRLRWNVVVDSRREWRRSIMITLQPTIIERNLSRCASYLLCGGNNKEGGQY